jgi:hypothetical protein
MHISKNCEVYIYTFFDLVDRQVGLSTPRTGRSPLGKTRYPLYRRLGWPQSRSWTGEENLAPTGIRFSDRSARSKSLYRQPKERDLATLSYFAVGRVWHRAVGAIIRFVILCFFLLVTTNRLAVVLSVGLLWQAGAYLLSSSYYDTVLCECFISLNVFD